MIEYLCARQIFNLCLYQGTFTLTDTFFPSVVLMKHSYEDVWLWREKTRLRGLPLGIQLHPDKPTSISCFSFSKGQRTQILLCYFLLRLI